MSRLQILNWGTFSGLHDIPIAEEGFLIVGRSGSGKSTLLDALSALLVPPSSREFNMAAREGSKGRYDRNLPSYIRGAWADREDSDSGEITTQYLRSSTTYSALAVEYRNPEKRIITLIHLYWLRGSSNRTADVKRHYMIAERSFDLATELKEFNDLDLRKLKQRLEDVIPFKDFKPYSERFCRLLGIESEMALKLLHKTQSAKNLGDLNEFLRDFMLDKPETFDVAQRMVEEFEELDAAHQAVVKVRKQVDVLTPAKEEYQTLEENKKQLSKLQELLNAVDIYRDQTKVELLQQEINTLKTRDQGLLGQEQRQKEIVENHKSQLDLLYDQHRELGGDHINRLENEKSNYEHQRDDRLTKKQLARQACSVLDHSLPTSPQAFAELLATANQDIENRAQHSEEVEVRRDSLRDRKREVENEFGQLRMEIEAMSRQPSNIPAHMLLLRQQIADALGLPEEDLPFVGELIQVKNDESAWQGAIERVLHGFALSLIVDDKHYASVAAYVNDTRLSSRLVYYRVIALSDSKAGNYNVNLVVNKLDIKESSYRNWLSAQLRKRYDYVCVDTLQAFRKTQKAITQQGQVRHGQSRHEKDDRHAIDDRRRWVLGFDNRDKKKLFEQHAQKIAEEIETLSKELVSLAELKEKQRDILLASNTLINMQWHEIDVAGSLDRIKLLNDQLQVLRSGNRKLSELGDKINKQKKSLLLSENELRETQVERGGLAGNIKTLADDFYETERQLVGKGLNEQQKQALEQRFDHVNRTVTLKNIEKRRTQVERDIVEEQKSCNELGNQLIKIIEKRFDEFIREWPVESANMDATIESTSEFLTLLKRLEKDGLPKHEERFYKLLKDQSNENLAALNTYLVQARKEIRERMELVNESLAGAEFNQGTHLKIEVNERNLPDVAEFKSQVNQVLNNAWLMDNDNTESRFDILRKFVFQFSSPAYEHQRWRERVLDVRKHVEFIGREYNAEGNEIEIHRSGAGKSGGQREKLATTCLAAALRYQLGGSEAEVPIYAAVVLDEAFGKADNEFTELAMKIFTNFGFQMIIATPLKSVMTLEPFIGGACFVDIKERKQSATLQIEYNREQKRLNLPQSANG